MAIASKLKTIYDSCKDIRDVITGKNSSFGKGNITTLGNDVTKICNPNNYIHKVIRDPITETQIDPNTGEETDVVTGYTYKREDEYVGPNYTTIPYNKYKDDNNLIEVVLPSTVTCINSNFSNCTNLRYINLNGVSRLSQGSFTNCKNLRIIIDMPNNIGEFEDGNFRYTFRNSGIIGIENLGQINQIRQYSLERCNSLIYAKLPSTLTMMESYAFYQCSALTDVYIYAITPPTISDMSFDQCDALTNIYVPAESVSAYQSATNWSAYASKISAIPT